MRLVSWAGVPGLWQISTVFSVQQLTLNSPLVNEASEKHTRPGVQSEGTAQGTEKSKKLLQVATLSQHTLPEPHCRLSGENLPILASPASHSVPATQSPPSFSHIVVGSSAGGAVTLTGANIIIKLARTARNETVKGMSSAFLLIMLFFVLNLRLFQINDYIVRFCIWALNLKTA